MEPIRERPSAEFERLRAEIGKRNAKRRSGWRKAQFHNDTTLAVHRLLLAVFAAVVTSTKAAESRGWLQEAIMSDGREHPQSGPGTDRYRSFAAMLSVATAATIVAA